MTRKTGLKLVITSDPKKRFVDAVLYKKDVKIANVTFWIDELTITVEDLNTESSYRRCGYSRLLMNVVFGFAEFFDKPVLLYSVTDALPFYEKIGFISMTKPEMKKRIITMNKNPKLMVYEWGNQDLIWLPKKFRDKRRKIRVYG